MSITESLLAEFEQQAPVTRKFLERLPEDKLGWKPHQKSMSAGQLALHLAQVPGAVVQLAQQNPAVMPKFTPPEPSTVSEVLDAFDQSIGTVRTTLRAWNDAAMEEIWRLTDGSRDLFAMPREQFLRHIMLNHWYQHRGQFGVYLRLLDVPVPASYGPSADEPPPFA